MRDRLAKLLDPQQTELLRQQVVDEGNPELKNAKDQLAKCQRQCESLMNCANNLFDLLNETKENEIRFCNFISEITAGEDKFAQKNRQEAAYKWSILDKRNIKKKMCVAEKNLDRIQKFLDELKTSKKE